MLIDLQTLNAELPALGAWELTPLCELIASLGFPIDGVSQVNGRTALDVDVTANRGDVMSHRGLARDLAAKLAVDLPALDHAPLAAGPALRAIRLEADACSRYATAELTLAEGRTPEPVVAFLAALGAGAKGLPAVDASNELLHRLGHPTHAFDADLVEGDLAVRWAQPGESLVTLDGLERKLTAEDLVIADARGPIALAGVMGGEATKVTAATRRVLLESAWFAPKVVRLMARRHNLHTDASHRFGRGADPAMAPIARDLLAKRLQAWAGATLASAWEAGTAPAPAAPVDLPQALLDRTAGEAIPATEAEALLMRLGCQVRATPTGFAVVPPSHRHDLALAEDFAEEVLRLRGYDRIPTVLPPVDFDPEPLSLTYVQGQQLAKRLAHLGFHQTVTYGFVGPEEDAPWGAAHQAERVLGNPLGLEYSVMRASLLPSLLGAARHNLRQGAKEVRLFEVAPTYGAGLASTPTVGVVWGGRLGGEDYLSPARSVEAADLRGIARSLGVDQVDVHDLGDGCYGLELSLATLARPEARIIPSYRPFSRHPAVERDLSLLVDLTQRHADLVGAMRAAAPAELQSLGCVDVFRHKSLPAGKQAWLLRLRFQGDRTLTGDEVDGWVAGLLAVARPLGAELRG